MIRGLLKELAVIKERFGFSSFFLWRLVFYLACLLILGSALVRLHRQSSPAANPSDEAIEIVLPRS